MRDCSNAEVRDRLPELVHGLLTGPEHEAVETHVAECPDCAAEAALIRAVVRGVNLATPKMDAVRIAAALPAPLPVAPARTRRPFGGTAVRWAAGLVLAAAGIGALQFYGGSGRQDVATTERQLPQTGGERAIVRPVTGGTSAGYATTNGSGGLVLVGGIDALSLDQLEALVLGVETLSAIPALEPDAFPQSAGEETR